MNGSNVSDSGQIGVRLPPKLTPRSSYCRGSPGSGWSSLALAAQLAADGPVGVLRRVDVDVERLRIVLDTVLSPFRSIGATLVASLVGGPKGKDRRAVSSGRADMDMGCCNRANATYIVEVPADLAEIVGDRDLCLARAVRIAPSHFLRAGKSGVIGARRFLSDGFFQRGTASQRGKAGQGCQQGDFIHSHDGSFQYAREMRVFNACIN